MTLRVLLALTMSLPGAALGGSLSVVVLGSGGPRALGRASTGYLVEIDKTPRILIDAGPGTFLRLGELKLELGRVDTVLLTHLHIDHTGELPGVFLTRALNAQAREIRFAVFGPAGGGIFPSTSRFMHELFERGGAWEYQKTFGANEMIETVDLATDLKSSVKKIADSGGVRISEIATHHGDCPSVAYRVDYGNESVVFSGDMDASAAPNLARLARGCTLLVFHCAVLDPPGSPEQLYELHTPPRRIGEVAREAGAGQLLLSHLAPDVEEAEGAVRRSIAQAYRGPVRFAQDKLRVVVHQ